MAQAKDIIEYFWPSLEVKRQENTLQIGCFGRSYSMEGPLPTQIVSAGFQVLASHARLRAEFNGAEQTVVTENTYIAEQTDDRLVYLSQGRAGNVILNSRITAERDGLIWVDLTVLPFTPSGVMSCTPEQAVPTMNRLVLELPLNREIAELYHYWPAAGSGGLSNSGSLPQKDITLPFRPHLWVGKEQAGLSFYAESDQYWQAADPNEVFTVTWDTNTALLQIHLLDSIPQAWQGRTADDWNDALEPVRFSFGLQASPVKPFQQVGEYRNVCHKGLACDDMLHPYDMAAFEKEADALAALGVRWRTFHEDWSMIQNYGLPRDEALFRAKVEALHRRGIKVMVYFGYEYASCAPGFFDDYRQNAVCTETGSLRGGWQRMPPQRDYIVCYASGYAQTMRRRCLRAMKEYGVDGIYTDGTYIPMGCANEAHGCGWTDSLGKRHETWPLRKVREHVRMLYRQTHENGGIVEAHQSGCVIPMILAYSDSYWDGEHVAMTTDPVTGAFRSLTGKELIEKYTGEAGAGVGTMRAEFTGVNFGIPCQFLSYAPTFDECSGLTLLYGVLPKPGGSMESLCEAARHWRVMDQYALTTERFVPFWREDCPVRCTDCRITCSVWKIPEGIMAVLVNLSGEAAQTGFISDIPFSQVWDVQENAVIPTSLITVKNSAPVYVLLKK